MRQRIQDAKIGSVEQVSMAGRFKHHDTFGDSNLGFGGSVDWQLNCGHLLKNGMKALPMLALLILLMRVCRPSN